MTAGVAQCVIHGWLSKLGSLFGSLNSYGTDYLGYPKGDPNFDNHPYIYIYIYIYIYLCFGVYGL